MLSGIPNIGIEDILRFLSMIVAVSETISSSLSSCLEDVLLMRFQQSTWIGDNVFGHVSRIIAPETFGLQIVMFINKDLAFQMCPTADAGNLKFDDMRLDSYW